MPAAGRNFLAFLALGLLSFHNNIIAYCWQKISVLFGFERAPSASISVHNNTSACRRQKVFGFLALKGHQLTRFILIKKIPIRIFLGGVGPILGGGVYFPSRGEGGPLGL